MWHITGMMTVSVILQAHCLIARGRVRFSLKREDFTDIIETV